jgi:hypothetical protein
VGVSEECLRYLCYPFRNKGWVSLFVLLLPTVLLKKSILIVHHKHAGGSWMRGSRRSSEMASNWRGLCPAVDCSGLMIMMMMMATNMTLFECFVAQFSDQSIKLFSLLILAIWTLKPYASWLPYYLSRWIHKMVAAKLIITWRLAVMHVA